MPFISMSLGKAQPTMTAVFATQAELPAFPKLFGTGAAVPAEIVIVMWHVTRIADNSRNASV